MKLRNFSPSSREEILGDIELQDQYIFPIEERVKLFNLIFALVIVIGLLYFMETYPSIEFFEMLGVLIILATSIAILSDMMIYAYLMRN